MNTAKTHMCYHIEDAKIVDLNVKILVLIVILEEEDVYNAMTGTNLLTFYVILNVANFYFHMIRSAMMVI